MELEIETLAPSFGLSPAWVLALLLAWAHGSLFFLLAGRENRQLLTYLGLCTACAGLVQLVTPRWSLPPPLVIGECQVLVIVLACWLGFAVLRIRPAG